MKVIKENIENKQLNESIESGWDVVLDFQETDIIDDLEAFIYELKNCVRGAYTKCTTCAGLGNYIKDLAERLDYFGDSVMNMEDPDKVEESKEIIKESSELGVDEVAALIGNGDSDWGYQLIDSVLSRISSRPNVKYFNDLVQASYEYIKSKYNELSYEDWKSMVEYQNEFNDFVPYEEDSDPEDIDDDFDWNNQ